MANAKIGSYTFNIDPSQASWQYNMKVNSIDTYGGKVNQILNCNITGMTVTGYITQKGAAHYQWAKMEEFEQKIKNIMDWQVANRKPVSFSFPALSWSGHVWVTGYTGVAYDPKTTAVSYMLQMEVDSGFESIVEAASSEGLENITNGINYIKSEYNYPTPTNTGFALEAIKKVIERGGEYSDQSYTDLYNAMLDVEKQQQEQQQQQDQQNTEGMQEDKNAKEQKEEEEKKKITDAFGPKETDNPGGIYSLGDKYYDVFAVA